MSTVASANSPSVDAADVDAFVARFASDLGAALHATTVVIGDRLGLYKALAEGPTDAVGLAARTGCDRRYLQEWLDAQAASGYCDYEPTTRTYALSPVQRLCLADESSRSFLPGGMLLAAAGAKDADRVATAFRSGEGVPWHEHHDDLYAGWERFFRPGYATNIVDHWLPALHGVSMKLSYGAAVADVGCGHGASTILMAKAFPESTFVGFDAHVTSVEQARLRARAAGVDDRVTFEVADAVTLPASSDSEGYDLVCIFDALHVMSDPEGAAARIRRLLATDGTLMIVEPAAGDRPEDNHNSVGRVYYAASTLFCTPAARAQATGIAMGAQAGERRIIDVLRRAGFARVRRVAETALNFVLEARP